MIDRALNHITERTAYVFTSTSSILALMTPRLPNSYDELASLAAILSALIGAGCAIYSTFIAPRKKEGE